MNISTEMKFLWEDAFSRRNDLLLNIALIKAFITGITSLDEGRDIVRGDAQKDIDAWFIELLLRTPVEHLLLLLTNDKYVMQEIPQISSFSEVLNATVVLARSGRSMKCRELGGCLGRKKDRDRNAAAKAKFGENHGKMAVTIGLVNRKTRSLEFEVSAIGLKYFMMKDVSEKDQLLARLLLRSVHLRDLLCMRIFARRLALENAYDTLAHSTRIRRISTLRTLYREYANRVSVENTCHNEIEQWLRMGH